MRTFLSLLLVSTALSSAAPQPFEDILGDDAQFVLHVLSLSETKQQAEDHAFASLMAEEPFASLMDALAKREEEAGAEAGGFVRVLEEEFGLTVDELLELFPGQAAFALFNAADMAVERADQIDAVILAEYAGEEARLHELLNIQFERNAAAQKEIIPDMEHTMVEEVFMGETLFFDEAFDGQETYVEDGYALVNGIFVLATPEDRLRSVVEAIKEGPDAPLSRSSSYLRARETGSEGAEAYVYLQLAPLMDAVSEVLIENPEGGVAAQYGVTADSLREALSLESFESAFAQVRIEEDGLLTEGGFVVSDKEGIVALFAYGDSPLPEADWVPQDVFSASISNFDLSGMLEALERMLTRASPALSPLLDVQFQLVQSNAGIDLRRAILENFDDELISYAAIEGDGSLEEMEAPQFLSIRLKNAQALSAALEAAKDLIPNIRAFIETQEFEGQIIHTIKVPAAGEGAAGFSYAITRSHFLLNIGPVGTMQNALSRMSEPEGGLWQDSDLDALFARIERPNAVTRSYADLGAFAKPFMESLETTGALEGDLAFLSTVDWSTSGIGELKIISEMNEEDDGFFWRALLVRTDEE